MIAASKSQLLSARGVGKRFGAVTVIEELSLAAQEGEFVSVVGPSGCGKTTLLMMLSGLMRCDVGTIVFEDRAIDDPPAGISVVFQDYSRSLLPWLSNLDNVLFGMRRIEVAKRDRKRNNAAELLSLVGLGGFERHYPWQVSGGMQQRVAIARALAAQPRLLLLDEPLAAVDAQTRGEIQDLIGDLATRLGKTCLLVTHDVDEAVYMADRVLVLSQRPTSVIQEIDVHLARPRDQIATKADAEFLRLRGEVLAMIRSMPKPI
jgi:NitT/TauT family transport system ATP-binding protein